MSALKKFVLHDISDLLREKKCMAVIVFINIIILAISAAFCLAMNKDGNSVYALFQNFAKTEMDKISISSRLIILYSFLLYTAFPLILGISAISYLKEFGELELIMLFPIDRKKIFVEKTLCIFLVLTVLTFSNFLLCVLIQKLIFGDAFVLSKEMIFFALVIIPLWLLFISCLTVFISSVSKDSKDANQKSLILPFCLLIFIQGALILKVNVFSKFLLILPLSVAIIGSLSLILVWRKKFDLEKILYK
ncbi:MAG: ABC transporter permease subunit [Treponema sp.]|nr:ABC transporter permease subunit [Treponema sp.]